MREKRLKAFAVVVGLCVVLAVPLLASAEDSVFIVYPTGIDDTDNLQAAFDAAVAVGPGSTVQLVEGTYLLTSTISVSGFDGAFKGAGRDVTVIKTNGVYPLDSYWLVPDMFHFYQEDDSSLSISDMSVQVLGNHLTTFPGWDPGMIFWILGAYPGIFNSPDEYELAHVDFSFSGMDLSGEVGVYPAEWFHFNPLGANAGGLFITGNHLYPYWSGWEPAIYGSFSVEDSSFSNLAYGTGVIRLVDSSVIIENNVLRDAGQSLMIQDCGNTISRVSDNDLAGFDHIGLYHGYQSQFGFGTTTIQPSSVLVTRNTIESVYYSGAHAYTWASPEGIATSFNVEISHNTITAKYDADAIGLVDQAYLYHGVISLNAVVSGNRISLVDNMWGGIWGYFAQNAVVTSNVVSGNGLAGIYMGAWGDLNSGWTILGNNVQNIVDSPYWGWSAGVWLGIGTSYCTVVGSKTSVVDQGYANTVVGVNNMGNPPGQDIAEAMEQKMGIIGLFRGL